ncbi:MAG: CDGSH iron-sulfur domain-containing protein [Micropepsaceae bacterium]
MNDKKVFTYPGEKMDVQWHGKLCIHIGECGRAKGELFVTGRQPWCQPDLSPNEEVEDVIARCPTGALTYHDKSGLKTEKVASENNVHVTYNGPLYVRGDLAIDGAPKDAPGLAFRAALCRCGVSKNKPFCDNSHEGAEFKDYGAVGDTGPGLDQNEGKLTIAPLQDGPLILKGNVTISSGSGRAAWRGKQVALCRCGASENKPFCDGTHKNVGFKS